MIIGVLAMLAVVTLFPGIDVIRLTLVLGGVLVVSLGALGGYRLSGRRRVHRADTRTP